MTVLATWHEDTDGKDPMRLVQLGADLYRIDRMASGSRPGVEYGVWIEGGPMKRIVQRRCELDGGTEIACLSTDSASAAVDLLGCALSLISKN